MVLQEIEKLGIRHSLDNPPVAFMSDSTDKESLHVSKAKLEDGSVVKHDLVVFAIGIFPRDKIARDSGIECHVHGGVLVNDLLETNMQDVYAIGEVACHLSQTYGLVAPGYDMADVVAWNLTCDIHSESLGKVHQPRLFTSADFDKAEIVGYPCRVLGDYFASSKDTQALLYRDPFGAVYKKYVFTKDGKNLLGGSMIALLFESIESNLA